MSPELMVELLVIIRLLRARSYWIFVSKRVGWQPRHFLTFQQFWAPLITPKTEKVRAELSCGDRLSSGDDRDELKLAGRQSALLKPSAAGRLGLGLGRTSGLWMRRTDGIHAKAAGQPKPSVSNASKTRRSWCYCASVKCLPQDGGPVTLPLKLGHSLKRVAEHQRGQALRIEDNILKDECTFFLQLRKPEWSDCASSPSTRTMYDDKMNKMDQLPVTAEFVKLSNGLKDRIHKLKNELETAEAWPNVRKKTIWGHSCKINSMWQKEGRRSSKIVLDTCEDVGRPPCHQGAVLYGQN